MTRHVLITGAAGGIGLALCRHFCHRGWAVTGLDINNTSLLDDNYCHEVVSVTDETTMVDVFDRAMMRVPLKAVFANAAVTDTDHQHVCALDYAIWQHIMRVNVDGAFLTGRLAAQRLTAGDNIIFVTSSLAFRPSAQIGDAPYGTSKAAVEMFMRVLALELTERKINVNSVFPSDRIDTGFFAHLSEADRVNLSPATLLNEASDYLANLKAGELTGVSLDQRQWDIDHNNTSAFGESRP